MLATLKNAVRIDAYTEKCLAKRRHVIGPYKTVQAAG